MRLICTARRRPLVAACTPPVQPEAPVATAKTAAQGAPVEHVAGVAAANPLAVDAGLEVLAAGGSAADAAVAIQAMLGLVEPQSSGVGGGGFMLYFDAATKQDHGLRRPRGRACRRDAPACSSTRTASRFRMATPCSPAARPACPARSRCWAPRTRATARCPGRNSSSPRSARPNRASPCRSAWRAS